MKQEDNDWMITLVFIIITIVLAVVFLKDAPPSW